MDVNIASFASAVVNPDEVIQVKIPSLWVITSVSLVVTDDLPINERVVLYASPVKEDGTYDNKIAIAPLRVGTCEVINVDYEINKSSPMVFYTNGAKIPVSINGYTITPEPLVIEKVN